MKGELFVTNWKTTSRQYTASLWNNDGCMTKGCNWSMKNDLMAYTLKQCLKVLGINIKSVSSIEEITESLKAKGFTVETNLGHGFNHLLIEFSK